MQMVSTNQEIETKVSAVDQGRLYVVSPYFADDSGRLLPEMPSAGPCQQWDDRACEICVNHDRDRKTGPGFPIRVVR